MSMEIVAVTVYITTALFVSLMFFKTYFKASQIDTNTQKYIYLTHAIMRLINYSKCNSIDTDELWELYRKLDKSIEFRDYLVLQKTVNKYREELELVDVIDSALPNEGMSETIRIGIFRLNGKLQEKRNSEDCNKFCTLDMELDLFSRILR